MARRKRESTAKRVGYVFLSLIFAVIALLLLVRLGISFHPGTGPAAAAVRGSWTTASLTPRLRPWAPSPPSKSTM